MVQSTLGTHARAYSQPVDQRATAPTDLPILAVRPLGTGPPVTCSMRSVLHPLQALENAVLDVLDRPISPLELEQEAEAEAAQAEAARIEAARRQAAEAPAGEGSACMGLHLSDPCVIQLQP